VPKIQCNTFPGYGVMIQNKTGMSDQRLLHTMQSKVPSYTYVFPNTVYSVILRFCCGFTHASLYTRKGVTSGVTHTGVQTRVYTSTQHNT
jgi:hypothetical protein